MPSTAEWELRAYFFDDVQMKQSVYVYTSVIGYLTARLQQNLIVADHQYTTRSWWSNASQRFDIYVSQLVVQKCLMGDAEAVSERLQCIAEAKSLPVSQDSEELAVKLIELHAVPASEPNDALHIAIAAANDMHYLVSWNFKHIVNASLFSSIGRVCKKLGFHCPIICTPEALMEDDNDQ